LRRIHALDLEMQQRLQLLRFGRRGLRDRFHGHKLARLSLDGKRFVVTERPERFLAAAWAVALAL